MGTVSPEVPTDTCQPDKEHLRYSHIHYRRWTARLLLYALLLGAYHLQQLPVASALRLRSSSKVQGSDFVAVFATDRGREHLLQAQRLQGVRSIVLTDHEVDPTEYRFLPSKERITFYPDDSEETRRTGQRSDTRLALGAFLAHKLLQEKRESYKWLFLSPVDTLFFLGGAQRAVENLDPNMPYMLSDNVWWTDKPFGRLEHPNFHAPRCIPCNFQRNIPEHMPKGCPCTPALICGSGNPGIHTHSKGECGIPRSPTRPYSYHGNAGLLLSIGLLRKVDWASIEKCVHSEYNTGADSLLTICLWKAGYAVTDPDPWYHNKEHSHVTLFDPELTVPGGGPLARVTAIIANLLHARAGRCDSDCQVELDHTVSLSLQIHELSICASAKLAIQSLITKAYILHRGVAVQPPRPGTTPAPRPDMTNLTATLALDGRMESVVGMLQQYGGLTAHSKAGEGTPLPEMLHKAQEHADYRIVDQLVKDVLHAAREYQDALDKQ